MKDNKLELVFDPNTIEHLGISLYSKLPSVLSELISNSWDADAENVSISFEDDGNEKCIIYEDDGNGMDFDELRQKYLVIGRNRRNSESSQVSERKQRPVIGKKGLGKLSVFGICNVVEVISTRDGKVNHFKMNLDDIRKCTNGNYEPEVMSHNEVASENTGLVIKLKDIRRKTPFDLESIALSLSKKFQIFDELNVLLKEKNKVTTVNNELKFKGCNIEFTWEFPDKKYDEKYEFYQDVKGSIFTLETPVKEPDMRGIYLTSRGKIVNTAEFYGARDNDQFHSYVTGYLDVSFIDEFSQDVIATDRLSLNWETDKTRELQNYLQAIVRKVGAEWRGKRAQKSKSLLKDTSGIDVEEWQDSLPTYERELSNKIIDPIMTNTDIHSDDATQIVTSVMDKFNNETFKKYASDIADITEPEQIPQLLKLMEDWKTIESKQFKDLAYSRIEVIKQFEDYIDTDTKEVPTLHNFLKKFSWLLDPRILEFKDEVKYSQLLKENFCEDKLDEKDRRIDFLCSNALGEILYVIEIKRSTYRIDEKALEQAYRYGAFLKNKYASHSGFSQVVCYVVGGEKKSNDYIFDEKERTYAKDGTVFVKTYIELLEQSKEYHKEFIEAYDKHNL